jgi:hypothetical protein
MPVGFWAPVSARRFPISVSACCRPVRLQTVVQMPGDGILRRKLAHHLAKADGGIEAVPDRQIVVVADSSFAAIRSSAAIRRHVCLVTRLRLDPNIFAPALGHPAEGLQRRSWRPWKTCSPCTRDRAISISLWFARTRSFQRTTTRPSICAIA